MKSDRVNCTFPGELHRQLKDLAKKRAKKKGQKYGFSTLLADLGRDELEREKAKKNKD
jgi:hypothetical protein